MKKITLILIGILFSFQIALAQKTMYVNSSNGINLREGPGSDYKTLGTIPNGYKVTVLETDGEWSKVKYEGKTGYVSSQYLSETRPKNTSRNNSSSKRTAGNSSSGSSSNYNRNWGIGLRGGDPAGLTVKKYGAGKAWELNIGYTYYWSGSAYRDAFFKYDAYETYRNVDIKSWNTGRAIAIQVRHLWQKDLNLDEISGLEWYYGVGGQVKSMSVRYRYNYEDRFGNKYENVYSTANFINIGADGIIGLEYTFKDAPFSIFTDINLFLEIYRTPFFIHGQGGIGVRYNF